MSSYLDKTGLERVWSKATDKFATIATTDELKGNIETLTSTKADKTEVETAVAGLVDSAPETLNTLNELAAALGDDPNFATTIATEVGKKVNSSEYNDAIAGINANIASITPANIGAAPTSHASTATTYGVGSTTNYGHLKVGSNISISSGTISLSKENITTALGYTPPTSDTNTHYTTRLYAGASGTAANAAATNPYLKVTDDNTYRNQIRFVGSGATTVSSDANGNITISSTDTTYNLGSFGITATAAELNYCDGVTSNIQTQLNNKSEYYSGITVGSSQEAIYYGRICKILLPNSYSDFYLEFNLNGRSDRHQKVKVWVQKSNTTAISNKSIYYSGPKGNCYEVAGYHYTDSTNGDYFEIWCKVPSWDALNIQKKVISGNFTNPASCVTWYNSKNTALPTTSTTITKYTAIAETWSGSITGNAATASSVAWSGITSKPSYYDAKAIKGITRSGTTFTYTCMDGTTGTFTQQDNNTTYSAGNGLSLSSTTFSVSYGTSASALGTSSAGSATTVSRSDHVHALPALTSCTGTLTVAKGGTGITSNPSMLVNLGSTSAASVFAASPRPGVTGTLPIGNGGTGATSKSGARTNLGITSGTSLPSSASAGDIFFLYS